MHLNQTQVALAKTKVLITQRDKLEEWSDREHGVTPEDVIDVEMADKLEEKGYIQRCDRHRDCLYITRKGLAA